MGLEDEDIQWPGCEWPETLLSQAPFRKQRTLGLVLNGRRMAHLRTEPGSICSVGGGGRLRLPGQRAPNLRFLESLLLPPERLPVFPRKDSRGLASASRRVWQHSLRCFTLSSSCPLRASPGLCLRPSGPPCHLPPLCILSFHFQSQTEAGAVRWSCTYSIGPGATECCSGRGAGWEGRGCRTRSEMNIVVTPGTRSRPPKPWAERSEAEPYPAFPFVPIQGAGSTEMAENSFIQLCVRDIFLRQPVPTYENLSTCRSTGEQTEVRKSAGTRRHFTHISNSSLTLSSCFARRYSKHLYIITYSGTQTTFGDTLSQLHR